MSVTRIATTGSWLVGGCGNESAGCSQRDVAGMAVDHFETLHRKKESFINSPSVFTSKLSIFWRNSQWREN